MPHTPWFHRQPTLLPGRAVQPERLYIVRSAASGLLLWMSFALYALHTVRTAGLTPYQLISLAVVLEITVVAFEIPTGILADGVSRRLSVVVGMVVSGVGWAVIGLFPSFEGILAGQFLWGFGFTFMSGAIDAWLADEVGEATAGRIYPRAAQWRQVARVAGVGLGLGLGFAGSGVPFVLGGGAQVFLGVGLMFTMTEAGWRPESGAGTRGLDSLRQVALGGLAEVRRLPLLRAACAIAFLFGASSEVFGSLWAYHLLEEIGLPGGFSEVVVIGGIGLAGELGGLALVTIGRRLTAGGEQASSARALAALYGAMAVVLLTFALTSSPLLAIGAKVLAQSLMAVEGPFFTMWVNRGLDPRTRATVLSGVGMSNSIGQVAQGPAFGGVVGLGGVRLALILGSVLTVPAAWLVRRQRFPEAGERAGERDG